MPKKWHYFHRCNLSSSLLTELNCFCFQFVWFIWWIWAWFPFFISTLNIMPSKDINTNVWLLPIWNTLLHVINPNFIRRTRSFFALHLCWASKSQIQIGHKSIVNAVTPDTFGIYMVIEIESEFQLKVNYSRWQRSLNGSVPSPFAPECVNSYFSFPFLQDTRRHKTFRQSLIFIFLLILTSIQSPAVNLQSHTRTHKQTNK